MVERRPNLSLAFGMAVSIIVHLTVLVPLLLMAMTTSTQPQQLRSELPADERIVAEEEEEREETKLGIDRGTPSSVSWVGYEEYEEHLAQLAEMDQAAFTREPSGAMGMDDGREPMTVDQMREAVEAAAANDEWREEARVDAPESGQPTDALAGDETASESMLPHAAEAEVTSAPEPREFVTLPEPVVPHVVLDNVPESLVDEVPETEGNLPALSESDVIVGDSEKQAEAIEADDEATDEHMELPTDVVEEEVMIEERETTDGSTVSDERKSASEESVQDSETEDTVRGETASPSQQDAESTEQPQQPQRDVPPGEVRDGEETDKDSDPTSIIDVARENWRLGKPLAARGVEIKPERPHFTLLQMMTASPRNPIVVIRFQNNGVPSEALMVRSTGDRSIDAAIVASLYRWRAEGDAIDALEAKQTFDIQIRIVLMQRRDSD